MKDPFLILTLCFFLVLAPCLAIIATIFSQRKVHNKPLKKRRKRVVILFFGVILFCLILISIGGFFTCNNLKEFVENLKELFLSKGVIIQMIVLVGIFLYAYFRKDNKKEQETI